MSMLEPKAMLIVTQHRRDREANETWKKKNSIARITLFCSMDDDIMRVFVKPGKNEIFLKNDKTVICRYITG